MKNIEEATAWYQAQLIVLQDEVTKTQDFDGFRIKTEKLTAEFLKITQNINKQMQNSGASLQKPLKKPIEKKPIIKKQTNEPVKFAGFYVANIYSGPEAYGEKPKIVNVYPKYDKYLQSNKPEDIEFVESEIQKNPSLVDPKSLYVLSARFYDIGMRDKAAFWFYVAQLRISFIKYVYDDPRLASSIELGSSFNSLLGLFINGYAYCNLDKQSQFFSKAYQWSVKNPYGVIEALKGFMLDSTHKDKTPNEIIKAYNDHRKEMVDKNTNYNNKLKQDESFKKDRITYGMDKKFCW